MGDREDPFADQTRIKMRYGDPFPPFWQALQAPSNGPSTVTAVNGRWYFGSAILGGNHVRPSKIATWDYPPQCRYGLNGTEIQHLGEFTLLPFDTNQMELIPAQGGVTPPGRRPVLGGYDEQGRDLYHCLVYTGLPNPAFKSEIPGVTSPEIGGGQAVTDNIVFTEYNYRLLVWKY